MHDSVYSVLAAAEPISAKLAVAQPPARQQDLVVRFGQFQCRRDGICYNTERLKNCLGVLEPREQSLLLPAIKENGKDPSAM